MTDQSERRVELARIIRDHIKVDATGLAPAVASAFVIGFEDAADAIIAWEAARSLTDRVEGDTRMPVSDGWRDMASVERDGEPVLLRVYGVACQARYVGPSDGAIYSGRPSRYNWFCETTERSIADDSIEAWAPLPSTGEQPAGPKS